MCQENADLGSEGGQDDVSAVTQGEYFFQYLVHECVDLDRYRGYSCLGGFVKSGVFLVIVSDVF